MSRSAVRILLVDDCPVTLRLIALMIRNEGYDVLCCEDPHQALGMLREHDVDILMSDHTMPGLTGIGLLALASRLHPNVKRVMLTGQGGYDLSLRAVNAGRVHGFLTKPMRANDVRQVLRDLAGDVVAARRPPEATVYHLYL